MIREMRPETVSATSRTDFDSHDVDALVCRFIVSIKIAMAAFLNTRRCCVPNQDWGVPLLRSCAVTKRRPSCLTSLITATSLTIVPFDLIVRRGSDNERQPQSKRVRSILLSLLENQYLHWKNIGRSTYTRSNSRFSAGGTAMSNALKKMVMGSVFVSGFVALAALTDLVTQSFPFSGSTGMDIIFIICAGVVMYLGYDTYKEMT